MAYLRDLQSKQTEPELPVIDAEFSVDDTTDDTLPVVCMLAGDAPYESDTPEADLTDAIHLLQVSDSMLRALRSLDHHYGVLTPPEKTRLKAHLEEVNEFLGQWTND